MVGGQDRITSWPQERTIGGLSLFEQPLCASTTSTGVFIGCIQGCSLLALGFGDETVAHVSVKTVRV